MRLTGILFITISFCMSCVYLSFAQKGRMDEYNILWKSQSVNSAESMPLAGGDLGCNVWVEKGELLFYMQRSGSFSENGEYLKLGRMRMNLDPNPFAEGADFKQELKLKEGAIVLTGSINQSGKKTTTQIRLWIDVFHSDIHIEIDSDNPIEVKASYENWRTEDKELSAVDKARWGVFNLEGYPDKVIAHRDVVSYQDEGVKFYHRNPEKKLIPEVLIEQQELEAYRDQITDDIKNRTFGGMLFGKGFVTDQKTHGKYVLTPFRGWGLKSVRAEKKHQLMVVTHIDQAESLQIWEKALNNKMVDAVDNYDKNNKLSLKWWEEFWNRSWISIHPDSKDIDNPVWQASRNYQLFRYQLGGNAFGEYPTKFNGGNLTFDPSLVEKKRNYDPNWRAWGGTVFTAQNQRLLYWPLLKSGDFEVMKPQFELYRKALGGAEARVQKNFGHKGAMYSEYISAPGLSLGAGYGWKDGTHRKRGKEITFGDPRATADRGYNDFVEPGIMANQSISYHWESQVEHAYMILEYHRYSGKDISSYIPFIKSALIFFDEHYQKRQKLRNGEAFDENGKLVFYPSTSCESYRGAKNPSDLISGLKASIEMILAMKNAYFTLEDKMYFKAYLDRIPGYYFEEVKGDRIIKPAESWASYKNVECPQFYPLFPFNQFNLEDVDMEVFRNTWKHGEFPKDMVMSWHQDGIFYARMGMKKEAAQYNVKKLQDAERRFPTFWGPGHDWVPDHNWGGSGMIGLQEMLMQCFDERILLFPAWPLDWDVDFKLHAPYNTTVEGTLEKGKVINLKVTPEHRRKDLKILNSGNNVQ